MNLTSKVLLIVGLTATVLLLLSVAVHLLTFVHFNVEERFPNVFLLHLGFFVLTAAIVILSKLEEKRRDSELTTLASQPAIAETENEGLSAVPGWAVAAYLMLGVYAFVNFGIFMAAAAKGSPMVMDGIYVLSNRGTIVQELTKPEYDEAMSRVLRGFSGHWLLFYFYIATTALYGSRRAAGRHPKGN